MINKSGRHIGPEDNRRHHINKLYQFPFSKFLKEHIQSILTSVLLLVTLGLLVGISRQLQAPNISNPPPGVSVVGYNAFIAQVKSNNILMVTIQGDQITGTLARSLQGNTCNTTPATYANNPFAGLTPLTLTNNSCTLYTYLPERDDFTLMPLLLDHGIIINTRPMQQSSFWQTLSWLSILIIPVLFFLIIFGFKKKNKYSLDAMDKNVSKYLKSRVRRFERTTEGSKSLLAEHKHPIPNEQLTNPLNFRKSLVTFDDVAGINEVRAELEEVVQFLRSPGRYVQLGAHIPCGILLVGPPGTGKTLLAKAVAGEADVPFFYMSASEFIEMFVGVGASRIRDLFKQARESAPCVVFLDEIDAVGRKRSIRITDHGERDQTLNQLLVELDGFNSRDAVIVLAATNRADILDSALLRPGRFDRQIAVSLPDRRGREAILRVHTRHTPLHGSVQLERLARLTTGMSGADLANLVNEAALCAARLGLESLTQECFEEALTRIQLGPQRPLVLSEADRRVIAFHESGHALVALYLPEADTVNTITILPRGQHLGVTQFTTEEDRYNYSRETLMARIAVGLGGRIAEELTFGPDGVTTGAENDLQSVTALAWRMVTPWGMGKQVGVIFADYCETDGASLHYQTDALSMHSHISVAEDEYNLSLAEENVAVSHFPYSMSTPHYMSSPTMATMIDAEVQRIISEGHETAYKLLTEHYAQLSTLAQALLEHEQLNHAEFEALLSE